MDLEPLNWTEIDNLIKELFYSARPYEVILQRLKHVHGVRRSLSWLKTQLRRLGLRRRKPDPPMSTIKTLIQTILSSSDSLRGYRAVWRLLYKKYNVVVRRDTVMNVIRQIDPDGVKLRRKRKLKRRLYTSKGPNYIWHLDGYDKLAPYGLPIHGCIDGFSRKLIWLRLSATNRDPKVVARYYLEAVEDTKGCPRIVRADHGTENCHVAKIHIAFRMEHDDSLSGSKSFIMVLRQPTLIEAWWYQLRRFKTSWWIDMCKGLQTDGLYDNSNIIERYTLAFTFGGLLQKDLEDFKNEWNSHPIRKNRYQQTVHGCPDDIYDMPAINGVRNQLQNFNAQLWGRCMLEESIKPPALYPGDFETAITNILSETYGLTPAGISHDNCRTLYLCLVCLVDRLVGSGEIICPSLDEINTETDDDSD